jgi:hypothetical protein
MKCACQKPPAACAITPGGSPSHIKKTMHFYPGDFDAFWRRRWQEIAQNLALSEIAE